MNISKITDTVYYVGVNDRTTTRFEGLWPLPYGVSYNSYVVSDEKTALIDTVHIGSLNDYLQNIRRVCGDKKIDYLVINHMEPDHSGSVPEMLAINPDMKIVGNKQTIAMVKGFYHIDCDDCFMEVKEGDTIELGSHTLRFFITPMVHWPETMMTYLVEDKLLFSGDAFGTFGALNGAIIDRDMECGMYIEEMYRYYSNIVGKYGKFVQNALKKLAGTEIEYICPTHGPVWNEKIKEIGEIVNRLSSYGSEPGATIIYGSMYGNTGEVAEMIATQLSKRGIRQIKVYNSSFSELSYMISDAFRYEVLVVGGPTYSMTLFPPIDQFMKAMQTRGVGNKVFASFAGHTWAPVVNERLKEYADSMKLEVVGNVQIKQSADDSTPEAVAQLADKIIRAVEQHKA